MDLVVIDVNRFLRAEFALIVCECVVPQRKAVRLENRAWMRQLVENDLSTFLQKQYKKYQRHQEQDNASVKHHLGRAARIFGVCTS